MQVPTLYRLIPALAVVLSGCGNGVNFSKWSSDNKGFDAPEVIVPIVINNPPEDTPPPPSPLILRSGVCSAESPTEVLSCLDCQSEPDIPPPPLLSRKAQELLDILVAGCSIPNKSDPPGYQPPSREQILKRLIQCSPLAYPDTKFVGTQGLTIKALLSNTTAQQSAFGGLYYNWSSTDFETYFGLEISEARYTLCRGDAAFKAGGIYPIEYYDSFYSGYPYELPTVWKKAQVIREDLRKCMRQSLVNPNPDAGEIIPGQKCHYETAEGAMSSLVIEKAQEWLKQGHQVYFESDKMCGEIDQPENLLDRVEYIKMAIKVCD